MVWAGLKAQTGPGRAGPGLAGYDWLSTAVPLHGLVRALPHARAVSGAAVQLCLQLCTPALSATTHHEAHKNREDSGGLLGNGSMGLGVDRRRKAQSRGPVEREREGSLVRLVLWLARASYILPSHANSLYEHSLIESLLRSLVERRLLLTFAALLHGVPWQLSSMHYSCFPRKYASPPNPSTVFAYTLIGKILFKVTEVSLAAR